MQYSVTFIILQINVSNKMIVEKQFDKLITMLEDFPMNPQVWAPRLNPIQIVVYDHWLLILLSICLTSSPITFPTTIVFKAACLYDLVMQAINRWVQICLWDSISSRFLSSIFVPGFIASSIRFSYHSLGCRLFAISSQNSMATTIRRLLFLNLWWKWNKSQHLKFCVNWHELLINSQG